MGKFNQFINRTGDAILSDRGKRVVKSAVNGYSAMIQNLENEIMELEDKKEALLDQSPDNRYSLRIGETFDGIAWAKENHSLTMQITLKKEELRIMEDENNELFISDVTE